MSRGKGILIAAAPVAILLIFAAGARLLPSSEEEEPVETRPRRPSPSKGTGRKSEVRPAAVRPKPVDARTQAILEKVVTAQLTAFAENDFARALSYSTRDFRNVSTPEAFQKMVRGGYPEMLEYESVRFGAARRAAQTATMPVYLKAESGSEAGYVYVLNREAESSEIPRSSDDKLEGKSEDWYVGFVSRLTPGGYPGSGKDDSDLMAGRRDL